MIIFVCDSRDYHAMDWFHVVKEICTSKGHSVLVATDITDVGGELCLIQEDDKVIRLFDINKLLFKRQSRIADIWRNFIKIITTPFQILELRRLAKQHPSAIFHAHSMYYIFLCWLARLKYLATPMGSDVLVRPDESIIYRFMTVQSLKAAYLITGDSVKMQQKIMELSRRDSAVIQNGIDVRRITSFISHTFERKEVVSIRGFYPNYQIEHLLNSRNNSKYKVNITFIYPFYESGYRAAILEKFIEGDKDLGRLPKDELYSLLASTLLVISIPESDSSPRSVYEAIFAGCCVAVAYSPWVDSLPECMRKRIVVVNLLDELWLENVLIAAKAITAVNYVPSQAALIEYDQYESMKKVCREIYKII